MKRLFVVLLAAGLIAAFSMPVLAVDVKFSGKYEVAGYWESNRAMKSSDEAAQKYYSSFLRIDPVFNVSNGLKLVTRFEGLERVAGLNGVGAETANGARNTAVEQNISMRRAYISAQILAGTLDVGYMGAGRTGTVFMNYDTDVFRIKYTAVFGPWTVQLVTEKAKENSLGTQNYSDSDKDKYAITPIYKWSSGEVGTQLQWYRYNDSEQTSTPYRSSYYRLIPWFKSTFGPLYLEGEINYYFGKYKDYLNPATQDVNYNSFNWYLMGRYTKGPAYIGAQVAVIQGDDPNTSDKQEAPSAPSGQFQVDYQPVLVLWNDWTNRWTQQAWGQTTGTYGNISASTNGMPANANIYQVFVGFKPFSKLDLYAAYSILNVNQKPSDSYVDDKYGKEFDITATYKIYDNLTYMAGFGYLWTGDYFKGTSSTNTIGNDWLLMHKLTLNF